MSNTMQIEVTLHLKDEDRARIDAILAALEKCAGIAPNSAELAAEAVDAVKEAVKAATPIETTPEPENPKDEALTKPQQAPEPAPKQPTVTLEQIRQKVVALTAAGGTKKAQAREIVQAYAPKISALPEDKLPEIWAKLTALDQEVET